MCSWLIEDSTIYALLCAGLGFGGFYLLTVTGLLPTHIQEALAGALEVRQGKLENSLIHLWARWPHTYWRLCLSIVVPHCVSHTLLFPLCAAWTVPSLNGWKVSVLAFLVLPSLAPNLSIPGTSLPSPVAFTTACPLRKYLLCIWEKVIDWWFKPLPQDNRDGSQTLKEKISLESFSSSLASSHIPFRWHEKAVSDSKPKEGRTYFMSLMKSTSIGPLFSRDSP